MNDQQKQALFDNTARALGDALDFIKARHLANCEKCHPDYATGVREALQRLNP